MMRKVIRLSGYQVIRRMGVAILLMMLFACGRETTHGEDYGDLVNSPGGLVLDQSKHEFGWQKSGCSLCHNLNNIHLNDDVEGFDMPAVRELVAEQGISVCHECHGTNGVP